MKQNLLIEHLSYDAAKAELITESATDNNDKKLYMKGIFIQGVIRNNNGRIYPVNEIRNAVTQINESIKQDNGVLGECDHPNELQIHLDRVSHKIIEMQVHGNDGVGKIQILPTPSGNIIRTLLESGSKLGVSSRGYGDVADNGEVSNFEILTVDIVAKPSAPNAYPVPMYEAWMLSGKKGAEIRDLAESMRDDPRAQQYLKKILLGWINELKL
jgi:hypothetical protein